MPAAYVPAVELREDIARIRQANRQQLKMQRMQQLQQGVPAAALAAARPTDVMLHNNMTRGGGGCSGTPSAARRHAPSPGAAAAEHNHVLRVSKHPGLQVQQVSIMGRRQLSNTGIKPGERYLEKP
jgi:hypothetical protein